jgi:Protein of unknown function (DUF2971)
MWAHYGDNHYGICLEFSTAYGPPTGSTYFSRVRYSPLIPSPLPSIDGTHMFRKDEEWAFENEVRAIITYPNIGPSLQFDPRFLTRIILGKSATEETTEGVRDTVKKREAPLAIWRAFYDSQAQNETCTLRPVSDRGS